MQDQKYNRIRSVAFIETAGKLNNTTRPHVGCRFCPIRAREARGNASCGFIVAAISESPGDRSKVD